MSIFDPVTSRWKHARTRQADNKAAGNENNVRFLGAGGTAPWLGGRRNAFQSNCVVYRCVRMIAEAGASMPVRLQGPDGDAPNHHLVRLLRRPILAVRLLDLKSIFWNCRRRLCVFTMAQ